VFDLGMYEELGMRTRHVVQGSGAVVFRMESGDVFEWQMCYGCQEFVLSLND
jgi:hypothetical protein